MQYIVTTQELQQACAEMASEPILGIDLECENNLHHYGTYISLIQISSKTTHWVIDVLALPDIEPLKPIFADENIRKLFHDVSFDLRILHFEFGVRPQNIFDTQIAALFVGEKDIGLGSLLQKYFDIKKESKFQMADWTKRPLNKDMLSYASKDTKYLIELHDIFVAELKKLHRLEWVLEEFAHIEETELEYKENVFTDFKGYKFLTKKKQAMLKNLFALREELAEQVDKPNHFVLSNKKIQEILDNPPLSLQSWKSIRGVHPVVKRKAKQFLDAVTKLDIDNLPKKVTHKRYTPQQKEQAYELNTLAEELGKKYGLRKHLILSKDQIKDIVLSGTYDSLRDWQKQLVKSV